MRKTGPSSSSPSEGGEECFHVILNAMTCRVYKCHGDADLLIRLSASAFQDRVCLVREAQERLARSYGFWPAAAFTWYVRQQEFRQRSRTESEAQRLWLREHHSPKGCFDKVAARHMDTSFHEARQPKGPKNAKNQGGGSSDATRASRSVLA